MANAPQPAHAGAAPQQPGSSSGSASDKATALAQELVDFIKGEPDRNKAAFESTPKGAQFSDQARKNRLVAEVAAKLKEASTPPDDGGSTAQH